MTERENEMRVEISGWDLSERFFVERGILRNEKEDQQVAVVHRTVRLGGLLFLRLLGNAHAGMSFPVAFRVREIRAGATPGGFEVVLKQMWPRRAGEAPGTTLRVDGSRPEWLGMR